MFNFFSKLFIMMLMTSLTWGTTEPELLKLAHRVGVNVGIYAPFSGDSAYIGRHILAAMELGQEQLIDTRVHYSFYTLDELPKNTDVVATLQKFIAAQHLNVLITVGAESGHLVTALVKKNNIIHFSLADDPSIADGQNNFIVMRALEGQKVVVKPEFIKQFQQEHMSYPSIEAGYAYESFQVLHRGVEIAAHDNKQEFPRQEIANQMHALTKTLGVMGYVSLDKKGVLHTHTG